MIRHYLKTTIRYLKKTKLFSFINILGLAVGMTACLLILHYVNFEKSYDKFHENSERIYRLRYERAGEDGTAVRFASCCPPAAPIIRERYPEVEKIARIFRYRASVSFGDIKFNENRMYFAEPDFLDILKFKFIKGDPLKGIREPNTAFISRTAARKYFGDRDPMGKTLYVDKKTDYKINGIFEDIPRNSHLKFDILLSFKNVEQMYKEEIKSWGHTGFFTYIRLRPDAAPKAFSDKLPALVESEFGEALKHYKITMTLPLQPLEDIHLNSHYMQEYEPNGDRDSVNFLFIIAVFIIVMAWVNYINLSTARSLQRAREVGLRKVVGATRKQLVIQFFFETILINTAAIVIAAGMVELFQPLFSQVTGTPVDYNTWKESWYWQAVAVMFLAGVFLSGIYPVTALTSFKPATVLKGKLGNAAKGINLRKALVVFQFVMALLLVTGTLTVYYQIRYMKSQALGFNIQQTLVIKAPRVRDKKFADKLATFKEVLLTNADTRKFSVATEVPGRQILWDAGGIYKTGEDSDKSKNYQIVGIDYDFVDLFDLEIIQGRNFSKKFPADKDTLILNETAVKWMGFESAETAVGQRVQYWDKIYTVVGVMKDYRQQSLKEAYEPHIFRLMPYGRGVRGHFAVKINTRNTSKTVNRIQKSFTKFFPGNPFEYFFLDDYYDQQYKADELFGKVFGIFALLAIFVTSLGILGLSSFMAVQRTKEIAVRKVLGATVYRILLLLSKDFLKLIMVSFIVALPLAILGINSWLQSFANRMSLNGWLFLVPLFIILVISLATLSAIVIRAASANPIKSLKYE